jgi:hypothetical protein
MVAVEYDHPGPRETRFDPLPVGAFPFQQTEFAPAPPVAAEFRIGRDAVRRNLRVAERADPAS